MTTPLEKFRQKYPMYNDMSDAELSDKLYNKYYSDMSRADFDKKMGIDSGNNANVQNASTLLANMDNGFSKGINALQKTSRDILQGGAQGLINLIQPIIASKLNRENATLGTHFKLPDLTPYVSKIGSGESDEKANIARGIGEYLPYGAAEGVISKPLSILGRYLATGGSGAASSLINDKSSPEQATESAALNMLTKGTFHGLEKIRPTRLFKSPLSSEELLKNSEAANGTETNLGRVIQNPELARFYENTLSSLPGTGVKGQLQRAGMQTQEQANNLATRILGTTDPETLANSIDQQGESAMKKTLGVNDLEDSENQLNNRGEQMLNNLFGNYNQKTNSDELNKLLNETFVNRQNAKNQIYSARDMAAENDPNFKMDTSNFQNAVNKHADALENTNVLKYEPKLAMLLGKLGKYKGISPDVDNMIVDESGKPLLSFNKSPTLNEATQLKSMLNKHANQFGASPNPSDRYVAGKFGDLAASLDKDINSSIENSGNDELKSLHDKANDNYKSNFLPFLDKDIYKYINGNADPDKMVSDLLTTGSHEERSTRLSKLSNLSPQLQKEFAKTYFNRSYSNIDNEIKHKYLSKLIDDLGPNQIDLLVPSAQNQKLLRDYSNASKVFQEFNKTINGDGTINHDFLSRKINDLKQNPRKFNALVPSKTTRDELTSYATLHNKRKDFLNAINSDGNVSPAKFSTLTDKLSKHINKYNDYVPDKTLREDLSKFRTLSSFNKENPMFNPPTGQKNKDLLGLGALASSKGAGAAAGDRKSVV